MKPRKLKLTPLVASESAEQAAVVQWWQSYAATKGIDPRLLMASAGGSVLWGDDKHRAIQAARMKKAGYRNGTPDLFLAVPATLHGSALLTLFNGLFIELKSKDGKESDDQCEMLDLLRRQGFNCVFAFGADECIRVIRTYLGDTQQAVNALPARLAGPYA